MLTRTQTNATPLPHCRLENLFTPTLLLDPVRFERNVVRMRNHLAQFEVGFRPHLKTAKSMEVARRVMSTPGGPAMVSTLREAEFFSDHGVLDLIYGIGIAPGKLDRVGAIRERNVDLAIILDSFEQAEAVAAWSAAHNHPVPALIEIDADGHRSGVSAKDGDRLVAIGRKLNEGGATLRGVLAHAGDSYSLSRPEDLIAAAAAECRAVVSSAETLRAAGLSCPVVSMGSTPTAYFAQNVAGVTEVRAGTYMFGDLVQHGIGTCSIDDIAISVLTTVIGHQQAKGWVIVDAGWMALSRDRGTSRQAVDQAYGLVCNEACVPYPDLLVLEASQEHGVIGIRTGSKAKLPNLPIGSRVRILPNHVCATAAQYDHYNLLSSGQDVVGRWTRTEGW